MNMVLDILNLNTSRKIIRAWFFFLGLSLFLNFSGVEDRFETGQLQIIKSTDLYCASGRVTAKPEQSDDAYELALFVGATNLKELSNMPAPLTEEATFNSPSKAEYTALAQNQCSSVFDFSKPSRAPPQA
jgi:hypothetical protein